ncbi:hypothetical protein H483_0111220 [Dietzia sp. UCD-THP]|uniref:hypothetical protein n=1 Tax=Dietzia sp. UCD-THP TaxID=1292020 RepID=UPI00036FAE9F|nr:hypothetical protein [Dietzia sp. UCD-THP]EYT62180.1 hypothetical protein H483_0111220 [Dietzia sp. UCD-THP]
MDTTPNSPAGRGHAPPGPEELPPGPLTTAELAAALTDPRDRGRYVRIWHGVYRREDQADDLRLRSVALARIWPEGVLRGRSAALLWGDDSAPVGAPPEIWLPSTRKSRGGRVYRYGRMPPASVTELGGLRVTTPLRTCRDLACDLDREDAVVAVERLCAVIPGLAGRLAAATAHPSGRGARRFADVVAAVEPRSQSAESSRARLRLAAAGFAGFHEGACIRIDGRPVVLPLADPALRCTVVCPDALSAPRPNPPRGASPVNGVGVGVERCRSTLRRAGWTVLVVRGPSVPANACRPHVGTVPPDAGGVLHALRSWWPGTTLLPPLLGEPVSDPLGMWAVRSA